MVNAYGLVTDREGRPAACYRDPSWPKDVRVDDLLRNLPDSRKAGWGAESGRMRNTTVTLVAINQKMEPAELQRLAIQVHTAMGRSIQPFATASDGDTLYAITTGEIDAPDPSTPGALNGVEIGSIASELAWDAVLASVPPQPALPVMSPQPAVPARTLASYAGKYRFSNFVTVNITAQDGKLFGQAVGRNAFNVPMDKPVELLPYDGGRFAVPGRYPMVLDFATKGKLVINPGEWAQTGIKQAGR